MNNIVNYLKANLHFIITAAVIVAMVYYIVGCEPTAPSMLHPEQQVTADILAAEFQLIAAQYEKRISDIELKQKIRELVLQESLTLTSTGRLNPLGIATSLMSIFGIAAAADSVRTRKKLKRFTLSVKTSSDETTA